MDRLCALLPDRREDVVEPVVRLLEKQRLAQALAVSAGAFAFCEEDELLGTLQRLVKLPGLGGDRVGLVTGDERGTADLPGVVTHCVPAEHPEELPHRASSMRRHSRTEVLAPVGVCKHTSKDLVDGGIIRLDLRYYLLWHA